MTERECVRRNETLAFEICSRFFSVTGMRYLEDRLDYDIRSEFGNFRVLTDVWFKLLRGDHTRLIDFYEQTYEDRSRMRHEALIETLIIVLVSATIEAIVGEEYRARRKKILRTLGRLRQRCTLGLTYLFDMDAIKYLETNQIIDHDEYLKMARQLQRRLHATRGRRNKGDESMKRRVEPYYRQFGFSSSAELLSSLEATINPTSVRAIRKGEQMNASSTLTVPVARISIRGLAVSGGTAEGKVRIIRSVADMEQAQNGEVGVFYYFVPDMVPAVRKCSAVIGVAGTGGMTGHLAIIARELDLPAVVGVTLADATHLDNETSASVDGRSGMIHVSR